MTTFSKVLKHSAPPRCANFTKIQNRKLLPVVKECANDSMVNNAMHVREIIKNNAGESGISIDSTWQKHGYLSHNVVTAISLDTKKCLGVKVLSDKSSNVSSGAKGRMKFNGGDISYNLKILQDLDITLLNLYIVRKP